MSHSSLVLPWRSSHAAGSRSESLRSSLLLYGDVLAVLAIVVVDWLTPAGVVVGILLGIPILVTSVQDDPDWIWIVTGMAALGFIVAAILGRGPISPELIWIPNRIFAFLTIPASGVLARQLQRRRLAMEEARDAALSASELNRLLMSLLAHDLRAPLMVASGALDYVEGAARREEALDRELIADVRARLHRSLRAIEIVLDVARSEQQGAGERPAAAVQVREEIAAEVEQYAHEAAVHGKTLELDLEDLQAPQYRVNGLVLRQALAIVVDNAVRHTDPGRVRVSARSAGPELEVRVEDGGPGLSSRRKSGAASAGSGLGLQLCRALLRRAGGALEVERDSAEGTCFLLRLPAEPVAEGCPGRSGDSARGRAR